MAVRGIAFLLLGLGLMLGGCMQATLEPASEASFSPRDKKLLANAPYEKVAIPIAFQRSIVDYHRKEQPGTIVVDTDARYLYYVLPEGKAIRYGVTVGEDAQSWAGVAKVGNMQEWPAWVPTEGEKQRLGPLPNLWKAARPIRWARAPCICSRAARTRCSASMAPTSRNISAKPFRRAASA